MAATNSQAPQRPEVAKQNVQPAGDVFIPAQVDAGQVPVLDRSQLKLPSNLRAFFLLLKVQFLMVWTSQINRKKGGIKVGSNTGPVVGGLLIAVGAIAMMAYLYNGAAAIAAAGFAKLLPLAAVLIGSLPGVILTFSKAQGVLFAYKDYDFIMSLPVKKNIVIYSRVAALYGTEIAWSAVTMLPVFVAYFGVMPMTPLRLLGALFAIVLGPNLAVSVVILLAFGIAALAAKLHFKSLGMVIGGIVGLIVMVFYVIGMLYLPSTINNASTASSLNLATAVYSIANTVGLVYIPSLWVADVFATGSLMSLFLFVLVSIAAPAVIVAIISRFNDRINAMVTQTTVQKKFATTQIATKVSSPFTALIRKELQTLIGYPAFFFNSVFGCVLMIILAFLSLFVSLPTLAQAIDSSIDAQTLLPTIKSIVGMFITWFGTMMYCAACSASISYSLEGRSNWLMATMPVSSRQIFGSKIAANLLYVGFASVVSQILFLLAGHITVSTALRNVILPLCICFLVSNIGMAIDVRRPNFEWTAITDLTKRSLSVMVSSLAGTFGSMIIIGIAFMLMIGSIFTSVTSNFSVIDETLPNIVLITASLLFAVIGGVIFSNTVRRGVQI